VLIAERLYGPGSDANAPSIHTGYLPEGKYQKGLPALNLEAGSLCRLVGPNSGDAAVRLIGCDEGRVDMLDVISLFNLLNHPVDGLQNPEQVKS
jgi:hypothetical protein